MSSAAAAAAPPTTLLLLPPLASGAIFGAALTLSRVYLPSVIQQQFQLTNFHMLQAFVAASACSALVVAAANGSGFARLSPRPVATVGRFRYDANVVGGALQGLGMVLTGACPGTVLVQIALGVGSNNGGGWRIALGGLLAGIVYVRYAALLLKKTSQSQSRRQSQMQKAKVRDEKKGGTDKEEEEEKLSVQAKTGLSTTSTVLIYELVCLAVLGTASLLTPPPSSSSLSSSSSSSSSSGRPNQIPPIVGGLLIGLAQATSVLFTRKTIGVSSAYEDLGKHFWSLFSSSSSSSSTGGGGWSSLVFALGIMGGAKAISVYSPGSVPSTGGGNGNGNEIGLLAAVLGGFVSIFGARLAGGCTSGHGISGMATMGLSSFVTVAAMFGTGIVAARTLMAL